MQQPESTANHMASSAPASNPATLQAYPMQSHAPLNNQVQQPTTSSSSAQFKPAFKILTTNTIPINSRAEHNLQPSQIDLLRRALSEKDAEIQQLKKQAGLAMQAMQKRTARHAAIHEKLKLIEKIAQVNSMEHKMVMFNF